METGRVRRISPRQVATLVLAIAAADILTTRLVPKSAEGIVKFAILVAFVAWAHISFRLTWFDLGFGRSRVASGARWGGVAMLVIAVGIAVLVAIPATRSNFVDADVAAASLSQHILQPLVVIPFTTVLYEETIFRGVLLGALLLDTTKWRAVLVASVLFGLWHLPPALSNASGKSAIAAVGTVLGTVLVTTFAGFIFSELRLRSESILAPVMAHTAFNSFAYVAAVVAS